MPSTKKEERLDRVFSALGNQTRRALLRRLARAPARITDLAAPFEMSLPAVSKHLRVLERAGLITRDIDGRVHRCSIDAKPMSEAEAWLQKNRSFWEDTLAALEAHVT